MIEHAITALRPHVADVVVCGREWPGMVSWGDVPEPGLGPLGGIAAALGHATEQGAGAVLTIGCDMPGVPSALLAALVERRPAWCADAPVLGCWPVAALSGLRVLLHASSRHPGASWGLPDREESCREGPSLSWGDGARGERSALSIRRWAATIGARAIPSPVPLRNVNTPADLA